MSGKRGLTSSRRAVRRVVRPRSSRTTHQSGGDSGGTRSRIYAVVRRIPPGRVATYGQIAALAGLRGHARQVGYAMAALPYGTDVPWHRVINAQGRISLRSDHWSGGLQRRLLQREGVRFDRDSRVALERYQWRPRRRS